jgi:uncharacterized protein YxeA
MGFIRTKRFNGRVYYYLVEAYRENGKPKQRVLKYLGKTIPKKYLKDYKKQSMRESRVAPENREIPARLTPSHPGKTKGKRHGRQKAREILSD